MKKNLFGVVLITLFICNSLCAQQQHCVAFTPSLLMTYPDLTSGMKTALGTKMKQIVSRNNAGATMLYGAFAIYPELTLMPSERVQAGLRNVYQLQAELTLIIKNVIDEASYGSVSVSLKSNGYSLTEAQMRLIQNINPTLPAITKMIRGAEEAIVSYYSQNQYAIITKANNYVVQKEHGKALALLNSVPACVPTYENITAVIDDVYAKSIEHDCGQLVLMAKAEKANGNFEKALTYLKWIAHTSSCMLEVNALISEIEASVAQDKTVQREAQQSETEIKKMKIAAGADMNKALLEQLFSKNMLITNF